MSAARAPHYRPIQLCGPGFASTSSASFDVCMPSLSLRPHAQLGADVRLLGFLPQHDLWGESGPSPQGEGE
jgi:hypothetical protein